MSEKTASSDSSQYNISSADDEIYQDRQFDYDYLDEQEIDHDKRQKISDDINLLYEKFGQGAVNACNVHYNKETAYFRIDDENKVIVTIFAEDINEQIEELNVLNDLSQISPYSFAIRIQKEENERSPIPREVSLKWYNKHYRDNDQQNRWNGERDRHSLNNPVLDFDIDLQAVMQEIEALPTIQPEHDTDLDFDH